MFSLVGTSLPSEELYIDGSTQVAASTQVALAIDLLPRVKPDVASRCLALQFNVSRETPSSTNPYGESDNEHRMQHSLSYHKNAWREFVWGRPMVIVTLPLYSALACCTSIQPLFFVCVVS